jgi:hypothetical protein
LARSSNQRCARRDVVNASGPAVGGLKPPPAGRLRRANTPSSPAQHHLQKLAYHTPFSVRDTRGSRLSSRGLHPGDGPRIQQRVRVGRAQAGCDTRWRGCGDHLIHQAEKAERRAGSAVRDGGRVDKGGFTAGSVSAATYDAAVSLLGLPLLIDLMSLAGLYASTAALLNVVDMQLDPGETHLLPPLDQRLRRPLTASGRRTACRSGSARSRRSTSMARRSPDT